MFVKIGSRYINLDDIVAVERVDERYCGSEFNLFMVNGMTFTFYIESEVNEPKITEKEIETIMQYINQNLWMNVGE